MGNRVYDLAGDITPETLTVDLVPGFQDMQLSFNELEAIRGDQVTINFVVTQNGTAFNLTGYSLKYQGKSAFGDTTFVFDKTATLSDATKGKASVTLLGTDLNTSLTEKETIQTQLSMSLNGTTQTVFQRPMIVHPSV